MGLPRFHIEGHVYYITTVTYNRLPIFTRPSFVIPLFDSLNFYRYKQSFKLLGYVIMPDHVHLLIWPFGEATVSNIMRDIKNSLPSASFVRPRWKALTNGLTLFGKPGVRQSAARTRDVYFA